MLANVLTFPAQRSPRPIDASSFDVKCQRAQDARGTSIANLAANRKRTNRIRDAIYSPAPLMIADLGIMPETRNSSPVPCVPRDRFSRPFSFASFRHTGQGTPRSLSPPPLPPVRVPFTHPLPAWDNIIIGRPAQYVRVLFAMIRQRGRIARVCPRAKAGGKRKEKRGEKRPRRRDGYAIKERGMEEVRNGRIIA